MVVFNIGANVNFPIRETTARVYRKVWEMAAFAGFLTGREAARVIDLARAFGGRNAWRIGRGAAGGARRALPQRVAPAPVRFARSMRVSMLVASLLATRGSVIANAERIRPSISGSSHSC